MKDKKKKKSRKMKRGHVEREDYKRDKKRISIKWNKGKNREKNVKWFLKKLREKH